MSAVRNWSVGNPKLTAGEMAEIRRLYDSGVGRAELCRQFHISGSTCWHITRGYRRAAHPNSTETYRAAVEGLQQVRRYLERRFDSADMQDSAVLQLCFDIISIVDDALDCGAPSDDAKEAG